MQFHQSVLVQVDTGSPIMTTLLNALEDQDKTIGLESCAAATPSMAMVAERIRWERPGPAGLDGRDG